MRRKGPRKALAFISKGLVDGEKGMVLLALGVALEIVFIPLNFSIIIIIIIIWYNTV